MIKPDRYWVSEGHKIEDISNIEDIITFDWTRRQSDDYIKLSIDTKGDKFRYPTNYGLEYSLDLKTVDYRQAVYWMISVFNFVKGCADMLGDAYDYECNMRTEFL